jgi:hypothetical protein
MLTKKIFLASSCELKEDRIEFEILINRKNKDWVGKGVFLELVVWEDFLDAVSKTRLQDEYDKAIRGCDVFVMLFCTKVGKYTEEEFETAIGQFKSNSKPFVFTYFKDAEISTGSADKKDLVSLWAFQDKLKALGHFYTVYKNIDALKLHFTQQLDKLAASGFIELKSGTNDASVPGANTLQVNLTGNGAIAPGAGAVAVGAGGVHVGRQNTGSINTGTQVNTVGGAYVSGNVNAGGDFVGRDRIVHGDQITMRDVSGMGHAIGRGAQSNVTQGLSPRDLEPLFAPLLAVVSQHASSDKQAAAVQQVQEIKAEVAKGKQADDGRIGKLIDSLVGMVPGAVGSVVSVFAAPILGGIAGPVTKFVLDKLNPS